MKDMNKKRISEFKEYLISEEKAHSTVRKYVREAERLMEWLEKKRGKKHKDTVEKKDLMEYKAFILRSHAPTSVNAALASINSFFEFCGRNELKVKNVRIQRQVFAQHEKEITLEEYRRLLITAQSRGNDRLYYLMQTLCSTGMRVSELKYVTVDSIRKGYAEIDCKSKHRIVFIPDNLCEMLRRYVREKGIEQGPVFITAGGVAMDRSNIWAGMKGLCREAGVEKEKVYPHNLRHLFARTFYGKQKDIVRLADILGHSSVNTTRVYTIESGDEHRRQIQDLGLIY